MTKSHHQRDDDKLPVQVDEVTDIGQVRPSQQNLAHFSLKHLTRIGLVRVCVRACVRACMCVCVFCMYDMPIFSSSMVCTSGIGLSEVHDMKGQF